MNTHSRSWSVIAVLAFAALLVIILISGVASAAGPWYVAPGGSDGNSCLSAGSPCATINGAIGKAISGDTIKVAVGTYTGTDIEVVLIDKDINLSGGWDAAFVTQSVVSTINGEGTRIGIIVNSGVTAIIERFVVQNGAATAGGGIYNEGNLTVTSSTVRSNTAAGYFGGGIYNHLGTLTLVNSAVSANMYDGIYNDQGVLTLTNTIISDNTGQGIHSVQGTLTLISSTVRGNTNAGILTSGAANLTNSTVSGNSAVSYLGGGIINTGNITLTYSTVSGNTDGGIWTAYGTLTLNNSIVSGNSAGTSGQCCWTGGGGITNSGRLVLNNSSISGNTVVGGFSGGGIANSGVMTLTNSTVSGNTDQYFGGGIYNSGTLTLNNGTVSGNTSQSQSYGGGGIYNDNGTVILQNSILADNLATQNGPDCNGTLTSQGHNLVGNTTGCTFNSTTGDLLNTNPQLFSGLIGSPGVHPLLPWSPAIDAGNPAGCTDNLGNPLNTDQRGVAWVGRCDIGAYEYDPANDPLSYVFLPAIQKPLPPPPPLGLYGTVTENGVAAAGVSLELRFFDGGSWSTLASTTTAANGNYSFLGAPSLGAGQKYYVLYNNTGSTPGRLWVWGTRELTSYTAGSDVAIGDFDIADIALVSPGDGAMVSVPHTFQWTPRPATPSDTYEFDLYDPSDGDPYFYTVPPLGYVGSYTLNGLPAGFSPNVPYAWEIWVYSPDGGYGISYESREVTFSNAGVSAATGMKPMQPMLRMQPKTAPELEDRRKR